MIAIGSGWVACNGSRLDSPAPRQGMSVLHFWLPFVATLLCLEAIDLAFALEIMPPALAAAWWRILDVVHLVCLAIALTPSLVTWMARRDKSQEHADGTLD